MSRTAETAKVSETGLAFTFQIASSACDSASSPVDTVVPAGTESMSSGSTMAASGQVASRCSEYFFWLPASQMVAHGVTSLPVPAVVGTAISGLTLAGTKGLPVASSATSSSNCPLAVPTIRALAVSMALPPPTATMASQGASDCQKVLYRSRRWATSGLGRTSSITVTSASPSSACRRSTRPRPRASGKVTSATRRPARSEGSRARLPRPE
ncbi:hypothetical protein D9M68_383270 [compost metagenome]